MLGDKRAILLGVDVFQVTAMPLVENKWPIIFSIYWKDDFDFSWKSALSAATLLGNPDKERLTWHRAAKTSESLVDFVTKVWRYRE